ncbi:LamG-like jellyroll fold domain-containing protein [Luteolibacter luteus]|uniref:LamG-like jellyroll fold domain-containing protein n=1 Tax=Luteolibacter luteus TaxID=2728835 RepID=A0A858RGW6_9BACT|nr:LamG-like jellyroll fold domain-containing protein [Luteolibacter luteus]QJE95363.1 hypothetical protein HHL09_06075 [Luteolibacter luteus]
MNPSLVGRLSPGIAAVLFGGLALRSGAVDVAGSLLIDLEAADYNAADGQWPQHSLTGIQGSFLKNGTPRLQTIGGAPALVLDGDGDFLTGPLTTNALHAPGATHSVEYWVYQGQIRAEECVLSWSYRDGGARTMAGFRYGSNPDWGAVARWDTPDAGFAAPHLGGPAVGIWHHIVVTYDGNVQKIYVDGALNYTETAGVLDAFDSQPIYVGSERAFAAPHNDSGTGRQFSGAVGKIRVHSGVLTDANVLNNYNAEIGGYPGNAPGVALSKAPVHRWSFNNAAGAAPNGTVVPDSIGGLEAVVRGSNATFVAGTGAGNNVIQLPGGTADTDPAYVDLPNGIISNGNRTTIEFWATQTSNKTWSRMLSFGRNSAGEVPGPGGSFNGDNHAGIVLYGNIDNAASNRIHRRGGTMSNGADFRNSDGSVVLNQQFHYAITFDPDLGEWRWYRDGLLMEVLPETQGPRSVQDINNWLGRSEYSGDQFFNGSFDELRIYNYTLSETEIRGNTAAGPNTLNIGTQPSVFQWTPSTGGTFAFNSNANWGGSAFPDAAGVFANMAKNLDGDQIVTLNTQATVGSLTFGDTDFTQFVTIAPGTGGSLEMNAGAGNTASITHSGGSLGGEISAPILLTSDTSVANAATDSPLLISGSLSGSAKLAKDGTGPLKLTGNNSGFTGGLEINRGVVTVGDAATSGTLGSGPITMRNEGTLAIDRSDNVTFSQTITGPGLLTLVGTNTLTNTGTISNTGNLDIPNGTFINDGVINGTQAVRIDGTGIFRGNSTATINGWTAWGYLDGADITVQDNASIVINGQGDFNVADVGTGSTILRMTGGSLTATTMYVGKNLSNSGFILQSGGTITDRTGGNDNRIGGNNAAGAASTGAYVMSGGELATNTNLQIGGFGTGSFLQTGGTVNSTGGWTVAARYMNVGDTTTRAKGLIDISGGVHNQNFTGGGVLVGEEGDGVLEVRGTGTLNVANRLVIGGRDGDPLLGATEYGYGVANLATGGTISTGFVAQDSSNNGQPYGVFNFHGGTLKANRDTTTFMEGLDEVRIWQQGAVIDTNGFNVTVLQPLDPPAGSGVATIPVTNGGSGYTAPPIIRISSDPINATGTGATAVAVINASGTVTGITITNPGSGYTQVPTVTVVGEASGSGLTLGTPTLAVNNTSGGLIKKGAGALRLNGFNTYTGNTVVEGGGIGGNGYIDSNISFAPNSNGYFAARITNDPIPTADKLTLLGTLNLTNASLQVEITGAMTAPAYVIANYEEGALVGTFSSTNLPPGWEVDYAYDDGFSTKNIAIVPGDMTPYDSWISGFFPGETDPAIVGATSDPDGDGQSNSLEFALGGTPNSGGDRAKVYSFAADSSADGDTTKELVLTFAVLQGTPAFEGDPSPTASVAGYTYTVQGSTDLSGFNTAAVPVTPVVTDLGDAPSGYEWRSFSLTGSNGTPAKGFLRVQVTP